MFNIFRSKSNLNFEDFIQELKNGNRDVLKLIKKKENDFTIATFDQLMSNEEDVLVGVNKVLYSSYQNYFDLFNYALVKTHDDGDVKYIFYSTTQNVQNIISVALLN